MPAAMAFDSPLLVACEPTGPRTAPTEATSGRRETLDLARA